MFKIAYRREALKLLLRIPRNIAKLIREKIEALAQDPMTTNPNVKPLKGTTAHRLRVGDWRIIYELDHKRRTLTVLRIGSRGGIYS